MKKLFYLLTTIFFLQATAQEVSPADYGISNTVSKERFAEIMKMREEKPYSSLFVPESACAGKEKELQGFVNEVATTDGNGNETAVKYQAKLNEKENELGDRNFDFEKMMSARFNSPNDDKTNACLDTFIDMAIMEWVGYFENQSKEFECGLGFEAKDEYQTIIEVKEEPGVRTDSCDIPYGNENLYDFYKKQMEKLKDIRNEYYVKRKDELRKKQEALVDQAKTQAAVGCKGQDCNPTSTEVKNAKAIEKFSSEWCCERISERFEVLGFTTMKDVKPNERVCNELINKDVDTGYCEGSFCAKTIGRCLENLMTVFMKEFYKSFVSSFDVAGWGSQLVTLWREAWANPSETANNIVKNMFGFDGDYMSCLNKKSQAQYVCQMIGKFAGSSAGFSAAFGGVIGLARGTVAGVAGKLAKSPDAKIIKPALKEAMKTGVKSAAVGVAWPYYAGRGVLKGTASVVKGTWKNAPYFAGKTARVTVSAVPELAGRSAQVMGRSFSKSSSADVGKMGEALQNIGARRVQRAQGIRAGGSRPTPQSTQIAAKYEPAITQAQAAVKTLDDQLSVLRAKQKKLMEGAKIKDGKLNFGNHKTKPAEFNQNKKEINELTEAKRKANGELLELKKAKAAELQKEADKLKASRNKTWNNVKGAVLGSGATANQYPVNEQQQDKKDSKKGSSPKDAIPMAAPVQGVGTGEGVPKPKPVDKVDKKETPAPAPEPVVPATPPTEAIDNGPGPIPPL